MPLKRGNDLVKRLYRKKGNNTQEVMELKDTNGNLIHKRVGVILHLDGSVYSEETYTWGVDSILNPGTPRSPMIGEEFKGWYMGGSSNILTFPYLIEEPSTHLIYALYEPKVFVVTYIRDWDDSVVRTEEVEYGQNATRPDLISVDFGEGYAYNGYTGIYTNIRSNTTIRIKRSLAKTATPGLGSVYSEGVFVVYYIDVTNRDSSPANIYYRIGTGGSFSNGGLVAPNGKLKVSLGVPNPGTRFEAYAEADGKATSETTWTML